MLLYKTVKKKINNYVVENGINFEHNDCEFLAPIIWVVKMSAHLTILLGSVLEMKTPPPLQKCAKFYAEKKKKKKF